MGERIIAVGIDLAVQHLQTGVCVLRASDDGISFADFDRKNRRDPGLRDLISEAGACGAAVAVDVPLGWPEPFVRFLQDPSSDDSREALSEKTDYRFESLRLRRADIELRSYFEAEGAGRDGEGGRRPWPLSVSTDKLGAATMRWHAIQLRVLSHRPAGLPHPLAHVIETYPAAARFIWRWKKRDNPPAWATLPRFRLIRPDGRRLDACARDELNAHEWDALAAALVAALPEAERQTFPREPTAGDTEGMIHLPLEGSHPSLAEAGSANESP